MENLSDFEALVLHELQRIANAQQRLTEIAEESRRERAALADQMKQRLQAGFGQGDLK